MLSIYFKHYLCAIFYDITILYIFLRTPLNLVSPFSAWRVWKQLIWLIDMGNFAHCDVALGPKNQQLVTIVPMPKYKL